MDRTLSGATTLGLSEPWNDGNKGVPKLTIRLFRVISRYSLGGANSTTPADWAGLEFELLSSFPLTIIIAP